MVVHLLRVCKELHAILYDASLCGELWRQSYWRQKRAPRGEPSPFVAATARMAKTEAGGWWALCREKARYDWRCFLLLSFPLWE